MNQEKYIGMDIHQATISVAVMDMHGNVIMECLLETKAAATVSPSDPLHRRLRQLRCLCCRFDCYRVERTSSRAGVTPAEVQRLFTAHFIASYRLDHRGFGLSGREARTPYQSGSLSLEAFLAAFLHVPKLRPRRVYSADPVSAQTLGRRSKDDVLRIIRARPLQTPITAMSMTHQIS